MSWLMDPIYNAISAVLTSWHWVWDHILPNGHFLGTTWDWVLAIVFLVITVRLILFPVFVKQIKSQRAMQALTPKVKELQAKHKGDAQTIREEVMKLYQAEKVNPLMGCLPMFLQIPVFFGLFHVLRWINPLLVGDKEEYTGWSVSLFDSAAAAQLFTAPIPAAFSSDAAHIEALGGTHSVAAKIVAAILVVIMMLTTFMTSRQMILKTGWQADPQQRMIQKLMLYGIPVSLLLSGWAFPIGVIIYWVTNNLISLGQQVWVLRKYPPLVTAQPEAPKTARERAAAAAKKEPGALARFFLVLPPPAKPTGAAAAVQEERRGWFGRFSAKVGRTRTGVEGGRPEVAPRSLAPRPGARPRAVSSTPAESPPADVDETPATPPASSGRPTSGRPAAPGRATGSARTPAAKAASPAQRASSPGRPAAPATGAKPTKAPASPNGTQPAQTPSTTGSAPKQSAATTGTDGASGSTGASRPAAKKTTPPRKGGQTGRKGTGRR